MPRVLISDPISEAGIAPLNDVAEVDFRPGLPADELLRIIGDYDALMVRSETKVTEAVMAVATRLRIIGRAGVGVDNIAVPAATERGIVVVNSPEGNTIAAAELSFALLMALARNIPQADASLRSGEWKRSRFVGTELYKKTLGVVGLGKIGSEVARRARAFGMTVIATDPFASAERAAEIGVELVSTEEVFGRSDFITLHVPKTDETKGLLNAEAFAMMKDGVRIVNVARGGIVDETALTDAIRSGKVAGAALDVFSSEPPPPDLPALHMPQNVVTPHLGASTEEAQVQVAVDVAEQIADFLRGVAPRSPVNMPSVPAEAMQRGRPYLVLAERIGSFIGQLVRQPVLTLSAQFAGDWDGLPVDAIARSAVAGLLGVQLAERVNLVNAPSVAQRRGARLSTTLTPESVEYSRSISITAVFERAEHTVSGTVFGANDLRITHVDGFRLDLPSSGMMIVTRHQDRPGVIGQVGTVLGSHNVNIAGMHVGRTAVGGRAVMALQVDDPIDVNLMERIRQIEGMESAVLVSLPRD